MADDELEKKLDEGLALLRTIRPPRRRIAVVEGDGTKLLKPEEVVYFTTGDRRLLVTTTDGKQYINFKGLSDMEAILKDDVRFLRVHKSFLVNLEHVTTVRTVDGGRELGFAILPELKLKVAQDQVKELEAYFGI